MKEMILHKQTPGFNSMLSLFQSSDMKPFVNDPHLRQVS